MARRLSKSASARVISNTWRCTSSHQKLGCTSDRKLGCTSDPHANTSSEACESMQGPTSKSTTSRQLTARRGMTAAASNQAKKPAPQGTLKQTLNRQDKNGMGTQGAHVPGKTSRRPSPQQSTGGRIRRAYEAQAGEVHENRRGQWSRGLVRHRTAATGLHSPTTWKPEQLAKELHQYIMVCELA